MLVAGTFTPELPDLRLYLQASGHWQPGTEGNFGRVIDTHPPALLIQQQDVWICIVGPFARATAGYFRSSDIHIDLSDADAEGIVGTMSHLPAYPEVHTALRQLVEAGFRLAALTNSVKAVAEAQLTNAGIRSCFEQVLSADQVRRLKPAPEPYRLVAEQFATSITTIRLVAAHAWDIAGALEAGCLAAFVARPGMVLSPVGLQPDIVGQDLQEVAEQIVQRDR